MSHHAIAKSEDVASGARDDYDDRLDDELKNLD